MQRKPTLEPPTLAATARLAARARPAAYARQQTWHEAAAPLAPAAALVAALVLVFAAGPAAAVNRCKDAQGNVTFSDTPCPNAAVGEKIDIKPASGAGARAVGSSYTPPPPAPTVAGRRARVAALDAAIASLTRQMDKDQQEAVAALDKIYWDMAKASKAANDSNMDSNGARASMAVSQSNIQGVSSRHNQKMRDSEQRLMMLKAERESILRAN